MYHGRQSEQGGQPGPSRHTRQGGQSSQVREAEHSEARRRDGARGGARAGRCARCARAAGLLVEFTPEERARAEEVTVTLEQVSADLERAGGRPLSEIVLEQRGPKG